ncbi:hypothetical protein H2248_010144 [Termitomyces sp. 'cryptogamus']|nr:hypothetical protein H2248_010144 [Termitomyces sp. 'cryptogamus']
MSTLSLAVASGHGVLVSPSTVVSAISSVPITWISGANVSPGDPQHTTADTESPVLSAVAPTPSPHPLASHVPIDPQPTTQISTLTVTETLTITVSAPSSSSSSPAPAPTRNASSPTIEWQNPRRMADLSAFNISAFSGGKDNLEVVQGIPASIASASASISSASSPDDLDSDPDPDPQVFNQTPILLASHKPHRRTKWRTTESAIQLFYPAGSINPAQRPVGGAQFYATPLDLTGARNVSLGYSVFFPENFDWVLGGKMPGLYGGHAGCSGGNAALDCWSTRLMWRKAGEGELYLYAPKDKQTTELCDDPRSVCDAKYGFSIGRGSFLWGAGRWTSVLQTVTLNTPGKQDGSFTLDVNGVRVIDRRDVFYRDVTSKTHPGGGGSGSGSSSGGGGLGGLLGTLLSDLFRREYETGGVGPQGPTVTAAAATTVVESSAGVVQAQPMYMQMYEAQQGWAIPTPGPASVDAEIASTSTTTTTTTTTTAPGAGATSDPQPTSPPDLSAQQTDDEEISVEAHNPPVGFKGLFFSSFFGGHSARYATPTDQYVWFKDFYMSYNSPEPGPDSDAL